MRAWARTTGWTALTLVIGSAMLAGTYFFFIASLKGPITYYDVYLWQFLAWAIWLVIAPLTFPALKRLLAGRRHWQMWLALLAIGFAILVVHAVWHGLASQAFSPYPSLKQFGSAIGFHLRFGLPADLAVLAALGAFAWRSVLAEQLGREIQASEQRFRQFFEDAVFGIFRSTPDGRFLMLNRSAANAIGYDTVEDALTNVTDISKQIYANPADREMYLETIRRDGSVQNWIWKMRRRDGSIMWNSETSRGVFGTGGELLYIEGTAKDITAEVEAREALQHSERRSAELRAQLADAQLRALKLQIKPHFLFNILNTVAMMIRTGETREAQHVVTLLGSMFRRFLEFEGVHTVALEQELAFVDLYLELERYRFEDRIRIERDIPADLLGHPVPTLLLQPLVENAVKHGLAHMSGVCHFSIMARRDGGNIKLIVTNDVNPGTTQHPAGYGIGLTNTRARLHELYEGRASFNLIRTNETVSAVICIPMEEGQ